MSSNLAILRACKVCSYHRIAQPNQDSLVLISLVGCHRNMLLLCDCSFRFQMRVLDGFYIKILSRVDDSPLLICAVASSSEGGAAWEICNCILSLLLHVRP